MNETHEALPNAPLALVVVEVRLPDQASSENNPLSVTAQRLFRSLLGDDWVVQSIKQQRLSLALGPSGALSQEQPVTIPRFTLRDRTLAVVVTDTSVTIEATRYTHYLEFRKVLETAISAAADVLAPDGVTRVGMRYINEIRVPSIKETEPSGWRDWVDLSLLAPKISELSDAGLQVSGWEGVAQYQTAPERKLILRYGPRTGFIVASPRQPTNSQGPSAGPMFGLDFDSFWEPSNIPEFDAAALVATCDELRRPIRALFDLLITDKLLAEFRRESAHG